MKNDYLSCYMSLYDHQEDNNLQLIFFLDTFPSLSANKQFLTASALNQTVCWNKGGVHM